MRHIVALLAAAALAGAARAQEADPLAGLAIDGLRACFSISAGRPPAEAAKTFGFAGVQGGYMIEVDRGIVTLAPPAPPERAACRISVSALAIDPAAFLGAVKTFLTTGSYRFVSVQDRVTESVGPMKARATVMTGRNGELPTLVTVYEILGDEYYLGPKIIVDLHLMR